ncbi:MAG: biotin--[Lachnospiraceae bacterium]|nr:biotin--[acetyl-CoA-carboxylase] ligase [Lachnospiraceae bacterium]
MVNDSMPHWAGKKLIYEKQMDSTNEAAKRGADAGEVHGAVFRADCQTAGKGRRGRSWYSQAEGNLYFTILLRPQLTPEKASMLTLVMAYAVAQAVRECTGLEAMIKWPNDIVVHGRKVCGILSEMKLSGRAVEYCIIGTGINVGQKSFATDIQNMATSLSLEAGEMVECDVLLQKVLSCFESAYETFISAGNLTPIQEQYNALLINMDRQVRVLDPKGEYEGIARGITRTGELLVELSEGMCKKVYAGEVSVRGLYGYV